MKKTTKQSSVQLREIAGLVKILGLIVGIFIGLIGALSISKGSNNSLFGDYGLNLLILAVLIIFWHYVFYVMISAYATIVENSDRSEVVEAILQVADNLYEPSYNHDDAFLDLLDTLNEYTSKVEKERNNEDNDVELEKIDITDIKE